MSASTLPRKAVIFFQESLNFDHSNGLTIRVKTLINTLEAASFVVILKPINIFRVRNQLNDINLNEVDLIVANSFTNAIVISKIRKKYSQIKIWFDLMDSSLLTRKLKFGGLARFTYFHLIEKRRVKKAARCSDFLTYISKYDSDADINIHRNRHTLILPNTIYIQPKKRTTYNIERLVFVGDLKYRQNQSMLRMLNRLAISLNRKIHVYGPGNLIKKQFENLDFHGYVQNETELYQENDLHLAPVVSSAGVKNKVINPLLHGVPVVTTKSGITGIKETCGIILIDDIRKWNLKNIEELNNGRFNCTTLWSGYQNDDSKLIIKTLRKI